MKHTFSLLVAVVIVGLCYSQGPTPEPAKGKCPREFSTLEYIMKPKPCRAEKPYCPEGLICCPCPKSGKKFCIRPRMDGEELSPEEEKTFWEEMKMKLMGHEGEDYDCEDDDDDDDDDHHEKEDKVFETDRFADNEKEHRHHHKKHRMRCHHKRMHKIVKIAAPIVGLVVLITIVAIVACCIRRRRQRMREAAEAAKKNTYTPGTFAPVPDKSTMKGFLGLDFSPEVFVKSDPPYQKLKEDKDRI